MKKPFKEILLSTTIGKLLQVDGKITKDALNTTKIEFLSKYSGTFHPNLNEKAWKEFYTIVHINSNSIPFTTVSLSFKELLTDLVSTVHKYKTLPDFFEDPIFTSIKFFLKPSDIREFYNTVKKNS